MRILLSILLLLTVANSIVGQDNIIVEVSGKVTDQEKNQPLPDVNIQIKGAIAGTITNSTGNFVLRTKAKFPFTLVFSSIGFQPQELVVKELGSNLQIALATQTVLGTAVVVTASRISENILKSPVAIEKLDVRAIRDAAASGFYDAL